MSHFNFKNKILHERLYAGLQKQIIYFFMSEYSEIRMDE